MPTPNTTIRKSKSNGKGKAKGGTVRPHSMQAEEALLGAMLTTPDAIAVAVSIIKEPEYFFKPSNRQIYKAISTIYARGGNVDFLTIHEYLEANKNSDDTVIEIERAHLYKMRSESPAPSHAEDYAKIVRDHYVRRNLQTAAEEVLDMINENQELEVDELVDLAEQKIYQATQERLSSSTSRFGDLYEEYLKHLEELFARGESITGLATGFIDLDILLSGLQRQSLVIVGARPATGKTSFALQIAGHIARAKPILFFSMEMSSSELTRRVVAQQSKVRHDKLQVGKLNDQEWYAIAERMKEFVEAQLYIDDNPALTVLEVRAKARRLKAELGELGAVFVDYMQLMSSQSKKYENRQVEVSEISRGLKILARELDCPVVVLSQLSRGVESRADKNPMLADLRESGSIEQDADVVMFLYRDEMYNRDTTDVNIINVSVAKHRSGPVGRLELRWNPEYTSFGNLVKGPSATSSNMSNSMSYSASARFEDEEQI